MIQELFGSNSPLIGGAGDRKLISIANGGFILEGTPAAAPSSNSPSPLASPSNSLPAANLLPRSVPSKAGNIIAAAGQNQGYPENTDGTGTGTGSNATTTRSSSSNSNSSEGQNLRCPRCDSSNTKFCYYNNYNLTQPRHFCKTCRRYWTKGGALRNVPIGGGCRKNKTSAISSAVVSKSGVSKFKGLASVMGGLDQDLSSNPVMWAPPHSSHILALLRGAPINPNPNPNNPSPLMKEEVNLFRSDILSGPVMSMNNPQGPAHDPMNHAPSIGLCSPLWRSNGQDQTVTQQGQVNHQNGYTMLGEVQSNNGIHALYQRLKLSTSDYDTEQSTPSTSTISSVLEPGHIGVGGDQMGYWSNNPNLGWSDLPTSNGAYP